VGARTKARKRAMDVLFEADQRGLARADVLAASVALRTAQSEPDLHPYAVTLVEGVEAHAERIDEILSTYSLGWTLDRMPAVDRAALRLGVYELLWQDDVPDAVAIAEAVALVSHLSTDESPGFVNGLLARIAEVKPRLVTEP
jgi:transcription antitermination protein NusB